MAGRIKIEYVEITDVKYFGLGNAEAHSVYGRKTFGSQGDNDFIEQ